MNDIKIIVGSTLITISDNGKTSVVDTSKSVKSKKSTKHKWGTFLGNTITDEQLYDIYDGDFSNIQVGDTWELNGKHYRVAHLDPYYGSHGCKDHCIALVPDESLGDITMEDEWWTNANGYFGSKGRKTLQSSIKKALPKCIKDNLLTHKMYMSVSTNENTYKNKWLLEESNGIELMSVVNVFGEDKNIDCAWDDDGWNDYGFQSHKDDFQFDLFKRSMDGKPLKSKDYKTVKADNIVKDYYWWLASSAYSDNFAYVNGASGVSSYGYSLYNRNATSTYSVRPVIIIKGKKRP